MQEEVIVRHMHMVRCGDKRHWLSAKLVSALRAVSHDIVPGFRYIPKLPIKLKNSVRIVHRSVLAQQTYKPPQGYHSTAFRFIHVFAVMKEAQSEYS
jgi:hypothetical protein